MNFDVSELINDNIIYKSEKSTVYRIHKEEQSVIAKVITNDHPSSFELAGFTYEQEILKKFDSPHIIKFLDFTKIDKQYAIITEDGGIPLSQYVKNQTEPISLDNFFKTAIQIVQALNEIHTKNIIHKDLNPANIVINPQTLCVKIIDFGIASELSQERQEFYNANRLEGSLPYISPEQTGRMNRDLDYRTDFYSLGVTFFELITGEKPFIEKSVLAWTHTHLAVSPPLVNDVQGHIPPIISDIIDKLLRKNPDKRYQSCVGLLHDLMHCKKQFEEEGTVRPFTLATKDINEKFQIPQDLTGRNPEILELFKGYKEMMQGESQLLLVSGYSGIGKTSLIREVQKPLVKEKGFFLCGKFDQYEKAKPYSAISEALQGLVFSLLKENETHLESWRLAILDQVKDNGQLLIDLIPSLDSIIGAQPPLNEISPQQAQHRFIYTFKQFFSLFTKEEHPIVLFLDDLQWADYSSLRLIEDLLIDEDFRYLYIIGSYRNNEVNKDHLLHLMIKRVADLRSIKSIHLKELNYDSVSEIVCKTTNSGLAECEELCKILYQKSGGNPFFINELLRDIFNSGGFHLNENGVWQCDSKVLNSLELTENVIDLVIHRLKKFPIDTVQALTMAAALGGNFNLYTLSEIIQMAPQTLYAKMYAAVQEGVLIPESNDHRFILFSAIDEKSLKELTFSFHHDKIQQACYTLLDQEKLPQIHNTIAKKLLDIIPSELIEEQVIDIVGHYNKSLSILSTPMEKITLCRLNILAGKKAKDSTAYKDALEFYQIAHSLLPKEHWQSEHTLSIELFQNLSEASYINNFQEKGEHYSLEVLAHTKNPLIKAQTLLKQIPFIFAIAGNLQESIEIGLKALSFLEVSFPLSPSKDDLALEYNKLNKHLSDGTIEDLINLHPLQDKKIETIMQILSEINAPAYFLGNEFLFRLIMLRMVNLSIENGNSNEAAFAYSNFTTTCSGYYHEYDRSAKFGNLALLLNSKQNTNKYSSKILFTYTAYVHVWNYPINEAMDYYEKSYQQGLLTGEISYANFSLGRAVYDYSFSTLDEARSKCESVYSRLQKNKGYISLLCAYRSSMHYYNFSGKTASRNSLSFGDFTEDECVFFWKKNNDISGITGYYLTKIVVLFIYEDNFNLTYYLKCLEKNISSLTGLYHNVTYTFYSFMVTESKEKRRQKIATMRRWCDYNDTNFKHFLLLMEAQELKEQNKTFEAIEKYEAAISFCKEREFLEYRALSKRLLAKFYIELGKNDLAKFYMSEAFYDYTIWGASRICEFLLERYEQYITNLSGENRFALYQTIQPNSTTQANEIIDLNAIIKASRMLSGEVGLDKLIDKYVHLIQENAGAERVVLLLKNQEGWSIEGEIRSNKVSTVRNEIPLNKYKDLPMTLFTYVERTRQTILLNNATLEGNFTDDPYIQQYGPNSLLMLPIANMERLTGILFVENRVSPNLFTSKRVEILKLLSAQVAVSIENALLYNTLEKKVDLRTAQLTETNQRLEIAKREADKANKAKSDFLANMSHEIRTPMNSILGFSEIMLEKEENDKNKHYLQSIHTSGTALLAIINDILDLSKVEAGKMKLEYSPLSLTGVFRELETLFSEKIKAKNITLSLTVSPEIPSAVLLDEIRLRQILINLIGNAIKFTHKGGVEVTAHLHSKSEVFSSTFDLEISVKDTGIGIERNQLEAIFEAFVQAKYQKEHEYGGTGLGLVISKRLAEMMNGTINVQSQPSIGSEFIVTFKDVEVASANDVILPYEEIIELSNVVFAPSHILIADDVSYNRELLKRFLEDYPFTFCEATDGIEVMEKLELEKPNLILLDIKMPNKDGLEVLQEIRSNDKYKDLPIIVITASVMRENEDTIMKLCDTYLRKPISKRELIKEIQCYIPYSEKTHSHQEHMTENYYIPPLETLEEFKKLASGGFLDEIFELSRTLEEREKKYGPFCKQLQSLSRSFLESEIIDLLNLYMES